MKNNFFNVGMFEEKILKLEEDLVRCLDSEDFERADLILIELEHLYNSKDQVSQNAKQKIDPRNYFDKINLYKYKKPD